jgi:hypothetical protein
MRWLKEECPENYKQIKMKETDEYSSKNVALNDG